MLSRLSGSVFNKSLISCFAKSEIEMNVQSGRSERLHGTASRAYHLWRLATTQQVGIHTGRF